MKHKVYLVVFLFLVFISRASAQSIFNHAPYFRGGAAQALAVCENSAPVSINALLAVSDSDAGQSITWTLVAPPAHGTAVAGFGAVSTGGIITPFGLSYTPGPGFSGTDVFIVRVSDDINADTTVINVTVNPSPAVFEVTGGNSYCQGGSGVHIGLNGSDIGISYLLYYGPSVTGYKTGTGSVIDFGLMTVDGIYTVQATDIVSGCASDMSGSATVTITPTVNPAVTIYASQGDTVCSGTMVTLAPVPVNGGGAPSYRWAVNGTVVSLGNNYTFIPADGDLVSVVMTSNNACTMPLTASGALALHVLPYVHPGLSITIDPGDTVCQYAAAMFTATPAYGGSSPQYSWFVNNVGVGTGSNFNYAPGTGDVVYCKMASDYQCRISDTVYSNHVTMTVMPMVIPHIEVLAEPGFVINTGQSDSLYAVVTGAGASPAYQWQINGIPLAGATLPWLMRTFHDNDSVTCIVTSRGLCDGISTFGWAYMTVLPLSTLGTQHIAHGFADIKMIPNPNNGSFDITGTVDANSESVAIEVTNMLGQMIYRSAAVVNDGRITERVQVNNAIPKGIYLLHLRNASGSRTIQFAVD